MLPSLLLKTMEARGDGVAFFEVFDQLIDELVGHDASRAPVGLPTASLALGQHGGILGINPAAMHLVFQQHAREATLQFAPDAILVKAITTGKSRH